MVEAVYTKRLPPIRDRGRLSQDIGVKLHFLYVGVANAGHISASVLQVL